MSPEFFCSVRGILGSMLMICVNVGVMMSYLTGFYMDYDKAPFVMMVFPIVVFVSFLFIPDTPMSLLERRKSDAAIESSLKFYLNMESTVTELDKKRFDDALELVHSLNEKKKNHPKISFRDLGKYSILLRFHLHLCSHTTKIELYFS